MFWRTKKNYGNKHYSEEKFFYIGQWLKADDNVEVFESKKDNEIQNKYLISEDEQALSRLYFGWGSCWYDFWYDRRRSNIWIYGSSYWFNYDIGIGNFNSYYSHNEKDVSLSGSQ